MAVFPPYVCRNPACHSYGKSHPNCQCGPAMAEGGQVEHFCSEHRPHNPGCEFYKDGGEVHPEVVQSLDQDTHAAVSSALAHAGAHHLLSGNFHGAYKSKDPASSVLSYGRVVKRGSKAIREGIEHLFSGEGHLDLNSESNRDKLHKYIEEGHLNQSLAPIEPEAFAEGGEVKHALHASSHMEHHLPKHNVLLQGAKVRINNYLNSLRPTKNFEKLAFDTDVEDVAKKRSYHKALDLADKPLSVLKHIKRGDLTPEIMMHFKNLYPEVHDHLSKKMTERLVRHQLAGEKKPALPTRQALSLFLGADLDSSFSPQTVLAIQSTFAAAKSPQAPQKAKKHTAPLKNSAKDFLTNEQASDKRAQKTS